MVQVPQHHVEAEIADTRHVPQHDFVAALGHDRQLVAALVGPHAKPRKPVPVRAADFLQPVSVAAGFGAGLMQVFQRCRPKARAGPAAQG